MKTPTIINSTTTPRSSHSCLDSGILVLIGSFSLHLVLGAIYLWGSINIYITSYLRLYDPSITL